jgi:heat shock protein HslJ
VKIRVILILFICSAAFLQAQQEVIKDKATYMLSSIYIGKKKNSLAKDKGHIVFNTKEKTACCFTSCNFIQLKYTQKDKDMKFTSISPGKDPCSDRLIGLESDFKENLPKVSGFTIKNKQLILFDKKDTLMVFNEKLN